MGVDFTLCVVMFKMRVDVGGGRRFLEKDICIKKELTTYDMDTYDMNTNM